MRLVLQTLIVIGAGISAGRSPAETAPAASAAIAIEHKFRGEPIAWHEGALPVSGGSSVTISRLDYLISGVRLERPDGSVADFPGRHFLVSAADGKCTVTLADVPAGPWKSISFVVGVEKEVNHADPARWPAGHALNPLENNLHWGWKGGYVFLAAEGRISGPAGRQSAFLYHVGGDSNRVQVKVALDPPVGDLGSVALLFHVDRLWGAVAPVRVDQTDTLTHSSEGDDLAPRLVRNLEHCFEVERREP